MFFSYRNALFNYTNYQSISSTSNDTPTVGWNELDMESGPDNSQSVTNLRETQKLLMNGQYGKFQLKKKLGDQFNYSNRTG